jgi:DNA-binding PadR family transcriptional regulator
MSLDHAILGFLQYGPSTGYDLKARFDLSVQHFWPADQSQIYRTLARLAEHGWAEREVVPQDDRPDRKVYRITGQGRAELRRWLGEELTVKGGRSALLVQIFFAGQLPDEELLAIFAGAAAECRAGLEHLRAIPVQCEEFAGVMGSPRELWCSMLTLECGIRSTEAHLAWMESVMARLQRGEAPPLDTEGETA